MRKQIIFLSVLFFDIFISSNISFKVYVKNMVTRYDKKTIFFNKLKIYLPIHIATRTNAKVKPEKKHEKLCIMTKIYR